MNKHQKIVFKVTAAITTLAFLLPPVQYVGKAGLFQGFKFLFDVGGRTTINAEIWGIELLTILVAGTLAFLAFRYTKEGKEESRNNLKESPTTVKWGVTIDDLMERDGSYYEKFSSVPFTGQSTGKEQGNFRRGKKDGPWLTYHENGQLSTEVTYKNGQEDGAWVSYHDNGQLRGEGTYKNGKPVGPWVRHHENGQLAWKGSYKNGQMDGPWVWYHENGYPKTNETWKKGKRIGPSIRYDEDGKRIE